MLTFKRTAWLALSIAIVALVGMRIIAITPLWRSQIALKARILKEAPLGSSVGEVHALIKSRGWELLAEWHGNPGKVSSDTLYPSIKDYPGVKGEYVIHADLGNYQGVPFRVGIDAFWGFDAAGRLVDLRVRKVHEGL